MYLTLLRVEFSRVIYFESADLSIEEFVPKTRTSKDNLGFLFGAGTSFESGYPLVTGLTKSVVGALPGSDRTAMDEVLSAFGLEYDVSTGLPNIEEISDLVIEHHTNSRLGKYQVLKEKIRELVREVILSVSDPDITNQVAFLERLKSRAYERTTNVWVFTTNYDLLIEDACAEVIPAPDSADASFTALWSEEPAELGVLATWRNQKVPS